MLLVGTLNASAAEILSATCNKDSVMQYTATDGRKAQVDEYFYFTIEATGDTKSILMQGAGKEPAEIVKNEFNSTKDDVVTLYSIKYACDKPGLRTFRFWAVDANGNRTPYDKVVNLQCYAWDETEQTVYSVDVANDKVRLATANSADIDQRINLTICTSINTYDLKFTNEVGCNRTESGHKIYNKDIALWIGSKTIKTNNIPEEMDVEAMIINERTMLPIKYVAECIDHTTVDWNFNTQTVTITYNY